MHHAEHATGDGDAKVEGDVALCVGVAVAIERQTPTDEADAEPASDDDGYFQPAAHNRLAHLFVADLSPGPDAEPAADGDEGGESDRQHVRRDAIMRDAERDRIDDEDEI